MLTSFSTFNRSAIISVAHVLDCFLAGSLNLSNSCAGCTIHNALWHGKEFSSSQKFETKNLFFIPESQIIGLLPKKIHDTTLYVQPR